MNTWIKSNPQIQALLLKGHNILNHLKYTREVRSHSSQVQTQDNIDLASSYNFGTLMANSK
jgi:hypothetical protein